MEAIHVSFKIDFFFLIFKQCNLEFIYTFQNRGEETLSG